MFHWIALGVSRHPLAVVLVWVLVLLAAAAASLVGFGHGGLFDRLKTSEVIVPGSESARVQELTASDSAAPVMTLVVSGVDMTADAQRLQTVADNNRALLDVEGVSQVVDPFLPTVAGTDQAGAMVSTAKDGYVVVMQGDTGLDDDQVSALQDAVDAAATDYGDRLRAEFPDAQVGVVSEQAIASSIVDQVRHDLVVGEMVGLPVAAVLMVIVFGGLLAAMMPLVAALAAIGVGMGGLWVLTFLTGIDSFILNVVSIIGVALSIDYGLLVVSRFREEAAALVGGEGNGGREYVRGAVRRSVATAGRTVTFSAVTIACALAGLGVMSTHILRTIGLGGAIVTLLALLAALTLVPALLALTGARLLRPSPLTRVPGLRRVMAVVGDSSSDHGVFSRLAHWVHRRPWWVMGASALVLVVMALPLTGLQLRNNLADYIPRDTSLRLAYDTLQSDYPVLATPSVQVVADVAPADAADVVSRVEAVDGVDTVHVQTLADHDAMTLLDIHVDAEDQAGTAVTDVVHALRDLDVGHEMWVGGNAAMQMDFTQSLVHDAPRALGVVVAAVMVLLFLMTGSLLVPLKALVINSMSLLASLGVTTLLFQNGLLGLPKTAGLETFIVACMVAFGFGLAMDYEVFLLARIKEYWDQGLDNDTAVERGLQRSGRIITSAAAIIIAVFIGFASGQMLAIKEIGIALAIMVATDATITRLLLVPATMTLLGRWNWWAPAPLQRLHARIGLHH